MSHQLEKGMHLFILDLRKVPVLRVVLPFASGIALCSCLPDLFHCHALVVVTLIIPSFLFFLSLFCPVKGLSFHLFFGICAILFLVFSGVISGSFSAFKSSTDFHGSNGFIAGRIIDVPIEKERSMMILIEAVYFSSDSLNVVMNENVQVYLPRDTPLNVLVPGTTWLFYGKMVALSNRGNPGEFDYASYMLRRGYRYNFFCSGAACMDSQPAFKYLPARVRQRIMDNWDRDDPSVAILSAITLGYRPLLDRQTKQSFSDAGAMHLLAVSGLHVGLVWWILDLLFRFPRNSAFWRYLKVSFILLFLWFYAAITGFSDSVTRSVTMFSLVSLSRTINRNSNIFNTLLLSGFILLSLKPSRILEPGFQLSYLAVFGIITLQPVGARLYHSASKLLKRIFDLVSVSIAAQTATLPLVLLYFNQFPVWFIFTNLTAIPVVSFLLAQFVIFSPFLLMFPGYTFFDSMLLTTAGFLQWIIGNISSLPFAALRDISLHPFVAVGLMISTATFFGYMVYKRVSFLVCLISVLALTFAIAATLNHKYRSSRSLELLNFQHTTVISERNGLIRSTYIIGDDIEIDPYFADYLRSLGRYPIVLKQHHVNSLKEKSTLLRGEVYMLSENLWALRSGPLEMLIAGGCRGDDLHFMLEKRSWDIILFRTGLPRMTEDHLRLLEGVRVIGDGTLREYEVASLKDNIPEATVVQQTGPILLLSDETIAL